MVADLKGPDAEGAIIVLPGAGGHELHKSPRKDFQPE